MEPKDPGTGVPANAMQSASAFGVLQVRPWPMNSAALDPLQFHFQTLLREFAGDRRFAPVLPLREVYELFPAVVSCRSHGPVRCALLSPANAAFWLGEVASTFGTS